MFYMEVKMSKKVLLSTILFIILFSGKILFADTIPGGDVSGTWYQANSPYYVTGSIAVPSGDTLTIEPGVDVIFLGYYQFYIGNGACLEAIGTAADSIRFFPQDTVTGWEGMHFMTQDICHLTYCVVRYALNSGIRLRISQDVYISHSTIAHCRASRGGGIFVDLAAALRLSRSTIVHNKAIQANGGKGGGICVWNGDDIFIDSCLIDDNHALTTSWDTLMPEGGGIYTFPGNEGVVITNCMITNNSVGHSDSAYAYLARGAGMYIGSDSVVVYGCIIRSNVLWSREYATPGFNNGGAGIYLDFGSSGNRIEISHCDISYNQSCWGGALHIRRLADSVTIANCTFFGNDSIHGGWSSDHFAIYIYTGYGGSFVDIANCIVANNDIGIAGYNNPPYYTECRYSDIYDNVCSNMPAGFGGLDRVNYNGDSCDCYYNIFMDPMFADTAGGDLHLTENSPCIDAGDPTSPYDPDSTITDMGRYYFDQTGIKEIDTPVSNDYCYLSCSPNPCKSFANIQFELPRASAVNLSVYDITGRLIVQLIDGLYGAGIHAATLDASGFGSGVYFYRLEANEFAATEKVIITK
jgi:hypothetical protein